MQFKKVTHVLFDLDGLLLGKFYFKFNENNNEFGIEVRILLHNPIFNCIILIL